ncbi:MAG: hypothetical protein KAW12_25505 [Candidatus Aminicenantes bacterium]|nr:hypothetical protein [Candidatus Aminicenantes bacterium]
MITELTLKNVDDEVLARLQAEANKKGTDLNTFILKIFRRVVGLETEKEKKAVYHDLDYLAGTWTKEEAEDFEISIESFNQIDETLWQ